MGKSRGPLSHTSFLYKGLTPIVVVKNRNLTPKLQIMCTRSTVQTLVEGTLVRRVRSEHSWGATPRALIAISTHAKPQSQLCDCKTCGMRGRLPASRIWRPTLAGGGTKSKNFTECGEERT